MSGKHEITTKYGRTVYKTPSGWSLEVFPRHEETGLRTLRANQSARFAISVNITADQQFALAAELLQMDIKELSRVLDLAESLTKAVAAAYNEGFDEGKKQAAVTENEAYDNGFRAATLDNINTIKRSNALFQVRDMLFPTLDLITKADLTTDAGRKAVVDAVRVLIEEARQYEQRRNGLQADINLVRSQRDENKRVAEKNAKLVSALELEVATLKEALKYQYTRGYRAAVREVTRAATKLQQEVEAEASDRLEAAV